jgi:hypothetical protein
MPNAHLLQPHPHTQVRSRTASRTPSPGLMVRLRTWWRRERLDEQLAEGTDPEASAELTLRAEQLDSSAEHVRLAKRLEDVVRQARAPATTSRLPRRREVRACVDELLALAHRLRADQPVGLSGVAMTALLLSDGLGPLYYGGANVPLQEAVQSARVALEARDPNARRLRTAA